MPRPRWWRPPLPHQTPTTPGVGVVPPFLLWRGSAPGWVPGADGAVQFSRPPVAGVVVPPADPAAPPPFLFAPNGRRADDVFGAAGWLADARGGRGGGLGPPAGTGATTGFGGG